MCKMYTYVYKLLYESSTEVTLHEKKSTLLEDKFKPSLHVDKLCFAS